MQNAILEGSREVSEFYCDRIFCTCFTLFHSVVCISTVYLSCFNILPPVCISIKIPPASTSFTSQSKIGNLMYCTIHHHPPIAFCFDIWYLQHAFFIFTIYNIRNNVTRFLHYNLEGIVIVI